MRLLEAPVSYADNPRARIYVIDHLNPGATIRRRIEVTNSAATTMRVEVYPEAASVSHGRFRFTGERMPNELSRWTSAEPPVFDLPPGSRRTVEVTVRVPRAASPGERYAVIWAATRGTPGPRGNVGIVSRVGIRVYLDVGPGGEPRSDFRIDHLDAARAPDGRPLITATVRNTGRRALDMSGSVSLSDGPAGMRAGPFPADLGVTLAPGDRAPVTVPLDRRLPQGPWRASLTLRSGTVHHTVHATVMFPAKAGEEGTIRAETTGPARYLLGGAALLSAIAGATVLALLRRRRQQCRT